MSDPTVPARVTAAKRLLEEGTSEYEALPPGCRAYLQEAIEFLTQVETDLEGADLKMKYGQSTPRRETDRWPTFDLTYTFTPDVGGDRFRFEADEVVIHDPAGGDDADGRWISAKRHGYLPFEEIR